MVSGQALSGGGTVTPDPAVDSGGTTTPSTPIDMTVKSCF